MFVNIGMDSLNTHYGQNIFKSDYNSSTGGQIWQCKWARIKY